MRILRVGTRTCVRAHVRWLWHSRPPRPEAPVGGLRADPTAVLTTSSQPSSSCVMRGARTHVCEAPAALCSDFPHNRRERLSVTFHNRSGTRSQWGGSNPHSVDCDAIHGSIRTRTEEHYKGHSRTPEGGSSPRWQKRALSEIGHVVFDMRHVCSTRDKSEIEHECLRSDTTVPHGTFRAQIRNSKFSVPKDRGFRQPEKYLGMPKNSDLKI